MHTALFSTQLLWKDRACLNPLRFGYCTQVPLQIPVLFNSVVGFLISSACSASRISTLAGRGAVCSSSRGKRQVSPEDKALFHGAYESVTRFVTPESRWELWNENPKDHEQPHPPLGTKTEWISPKHVPGKFGLAEALGAARMPAFDAKAQPCWICTEELRLYPNLAKVCAEIQSWLLSRREVTSTHPSLCRHLVSLLQNAAR